MNPNRNADRPSTPTATASIAPGATHANPAMPILGNAHASRRPAPIASAGRNFEIEIVSELFNGGELAEAQMRAQGTTCVGLIPAGQSGTPVADSAPERA